MKSLFKTIAAGIVLSVMFGCATPAQTAFKADMVTQTNITNLRETEATVFSSGQPSKEQIALAAKAGIKHIINLRPASEQDWDEGSYVQSQGIQYYNIPVAGIEDVTSDNAKSLRKLLDSFGKEPALVHCSSGNRVGALITVAEHDINGRDTEAAIAEGRRWGLTKLEPAVRKKLLAE